jgi:hypothetical protein
LVRSCCEVKEAGIVASVGDVHLLRKTLPQALYRWPQPQQNATRNFQFARLLARFLIFQKCSVLVLSCVEFP